MCIHGSFPRGISRVFASLQTCVYTVAAKGEVRISQGGLIIVNEIALSRSINLLHIKSLHNT
jgi:hypothetical protein